MPDDLVISTCGLTKSYRGVPILNSLDLKVPRNSIFGFLGPNGAGKSTTIRLMLGMIRPTGGSCSVFGMDVGRDGMAVRRRIGYLSQDPHYYDYMTARQTVRYVARFFYRGPLRRIDERVEECIQMVGLGDRADRQIKGFSGGERQRLGIAQALVNSPDLLILDEPAASLDPMGRHDVLAIMERLRGTTTIFYSTHILEDVQRVSDTVAILDKGRLIAQAPIEKLLNGSGNATYSIIARGGEAAIRESLSRLPWVASVAATPLNGYVRYEVAVADCDAAEEQLFGVIGSCGEIRVKEFRLKQNSLEDVFINVVEGEKDA